MVELDVIRLYIPVFGVFRNRFYDESFTLVVSSFVAFVAFGYVKWLFNALVNGIPSGRTTKSNRCHFCESSNSEAIVDPVTDFCQSCGQLNAFDEDGDYSRPLPELYHAQMNARSTCETPTSKRLGCRNNGSPQPATAPGNLLCNRCIDNQEKIVVMKANFVPSSGGDAVFEREYALFERQLEKDFPLCPACQSRVHQFVGEQDRQIAATVASTTPAGTQHRLFMAKRGPMVTNGDVFVPSQRVYRRNKLITMLTLLSAVFPLFWGPFDLPVFWTCRIFFNFMAVGLAIVSAITSPYRRMPLTPFAIIALATVVAIDWLTVFYYLNYITAEQLASYRLKFIAGFASSIIQFFPMIVSFFAFLNAVSLLPHDKQRSFANGAFNRQNSATTMNGSPAPSEPYVTSLLAETIVHKRRQPGMQSPWRAFSSTKSVYKQSNYSPYSNGSTSPGVSHRRPSLTSNVTVYLLIGAFAGAAVIAYAYLAL